MDRMEGISTGRNEPLVDQLLVLEDEVEVNSALARWRSSAILNSIWEAVPSVVERFDKVVSSEDLAPFLEQAVNQVLSESPELNAEFENKLRANLEESYGDLGDNCPTNIAELVVRDSAAEQIAGTMGNSRDYLMQRLTAVGSMQDILKVMPKGLPESLKQGYQAEMEKLAVFLVAVEQYEMFMRSDQAAVAK